MTSAAVPLDAASIEKALTADEPEPIQIRDVSDPRHRSFRRRNELDDLLRGVHLRRGVVLTPHDRLAIYGNNVGKADPEMVERLARPELWVVVFPYSTPRARAILGEDTEWRGNPRASLGSSAGRGGEVLWPTEVRLQVVGEKPRRLIEPLWSDDREVQPFMGEYATEWVPRRSLVVAYPLDDPAILARRARLIVEYQVERGPTPTDSLYWQLLSIPLERWQEALGLRASAGANAR